MPALRYTARDGTGHSESGLQHAASVEALSAELRSRGLLVLDIRPAESRTAAPGQGWRYLRSLDVETGFLQLATMLHSGLSLLTALRTVARHAPKPRISRAWNEVADRIERGSTFSSALASGGRNFPPFAVQMVNVGETSGNLDMALRRAAAQLESSRQLRATLVQALTYPAIVTVVASGVAAFLVLGVIPKIQKYLAGHGRSLPAMTEALLDVSAFLQTWLPYIAGGLILLFLSILAIRQWPPGRLAVDRAVLRIPIIGKAVRLAGTTAAARGLSVLLESGLALVQSLQTVQSLLPGSAFRFRISSARDAVLRGSSLAGGLKEGREFMPMLAEMTAVGESAGTLPEVLEEVGRFHEHQLLAVIRRMSMLFEPFIILVVGSIVGFVYLAFFLALFSLAGGIR